MEHAAVGSAHGALGNCDKNAEYTCLEAGKCMMRADLIGRFKPCMTEIYIPI